MRIEDIALDHIKSALGAKLANGIADLLDEDGVWDGCREWLENTFEGSHADLRFNDDGGFDIWTSMGGSDMVLVLPLSLTRLNHPEDHVEASGYADAINALIAKLENHRDMTLELFEAKQAVIIKEQQEHAERKTPEGRKKMADELIAKFGDVEGAEEKIRAALKV